MSDTDQPAPHHPDQLRSPRRGMCAAVLSLEAVLMLLLAPVMIQLSDVSWGVTVAVAGSCALVLLALAGRLRSPAAYAVGWAMQGVLIGFGFVVPTMFVVGVVFAALWATADLLGRKIDRERAAAYAAHAEALRAEGHPQP